MEFDQKYPLHSNGVTYMVNPLDLLYIKASGAYCIVNLLSGTQFRVSKNLKTLSSIFSEDKLFVKVHRSYYVNLNHIQNIYYLNGRLHALLRGNQDIPIALYKKKEIIDMISVHTREPLLYKQNAYQ